MAKLTSEEREILINALVENEAIEEDDRDTFSELKDSKLIAFADAVLNAEVEDDEDEDDEDEDLVDNEESEDEESEDEDDDEEFEDDDDEELATNAHVCNKCAGKMKGKKGKPAPEEDDEEMTENSMTSEEWLASAPPEIAEVVNNAMKFATDEKAKLIESMTVNLQGEQKKAAIKALSVNSLDQLKVLAPMVTKPAPVVNSTPVAGLHRVNYAGSSTPGRTVTANKDKKSEPLIMPTINWAEAAKEFSNQN